LGEHEAAEGSRDQGKAHWDWVEMQKHSRTGGPADWRSLESEKLPGFASRRGAGSARAWRCHHVEHDGREEHVRMPRPGEGRPPSEAGARAPKRVRPVSRSRRPPANPNGTGVNPPAVVSLVIWPNSS
jgi:hypothetical protein